MRRRHEPPQPGLITWCEFCVVEMATHVATVRQTVRWREGQQAKLCHRCVEELTRRRKVVAAEPMERTEASRA